MTEPLTLLATRPAGDPVATLILAHGAGAPMDSDFMNALCEALAQRGVATRRFEFPYMRRRRETGGKRPPDRQPVLLESWREVYAQVEAENPAGPLLIGGKSMGGRMASLAALELAPAGWCCFGFPFHPPGKPEKVRTEHFPSLQVPGLILQGTRDPFGKPDQIETGNWPACIELTWLEDGDHDFKPRKRSGLTQADLIERAAQNVADFARRL